MEFISKPKITIFFGGPSSESDISLDSARTFYDSIKSDFYNNIQLIFISPDIQFFDLESQWIYSNKIEDFYRPDQNHLSLIAKKSLDRIIKESDVLCPLLHGKYGEDGQLTELFEGFGRKSFIGSSSEALATLYSKVSTLNTLENLNFPTTNYRFIQGDELTSGNDLDFADSFSDQTEIFVKPNRGGSSDGVSVGRKGDLQNAITHARKYDEDILLEERIFGKEFSVILIQDIHNNTIPLFPSEIVIEDVIGGEFNFYTRIKKYMPGSGAKHVTPMAVEENLLNQIRQQAAELFEKFSLWDWARFDGFLTASNEIYWTDLNGIPGYGLDSFLFQQASIFGLSQRSISLMLIERALKREGRKLKFSHKQKEKKSVVSVLGGGITSERHVSRMSWLNIIQKLNTLQAYDVRAIYVDDQGAYWHVPVFIALQHTVDEIEEIIKHHDAYMQAVESANSELEQIDTNLCEMKDVENFSPLQLSLEEVARSSDFVFIALHGGEGEDGTIQEKLELFGVPYNGSGPKVSKLTMNKNKTALALSDLSLPDFRPANQYVLSVAEIKNILNSININYSEFTEKSGHSTEIELLEILKTEKFSQFELLITPLIKEWKSKLNSLEGLVIKPVSDGCSSGVLVAKNKCTEVSKYLFLVACGVREFPMYILGGMFANVSKELKLRMPHEKCEELLVEEFLGGEDKIEITVAVLGAKDQLAALIPSQTPSEFGVLSLEEKFCKGMGVNLTPPPGLGEDQILSIRKRVEKFVRAIGIEGYARIDCMYDTKEDNLFLIEINSLPGMSMATVTFTQASVTPGVNLEPENFINELIKLGKSKFQNIDI